MGHRFEQKPNGQRAVHIKKRSGAVLNDSVLNKDTAFTHKEREVLGLMGLLPNHVSSLKEQVTRSYGNLTRKHDPLEQYIGLAALQNRNETVFYRLLFEHIEELMPIVYTPTVGEACRYYSKIFRHSHGIWITPDHRGRIKEVLDEADEDDVHMIVATDNEGILGIGDQGAGGMGIAIGKLALYTVAAGIHPSNTLPISLDVGTNNQKLAKDELYLGWPHARLHGEEYFSLIEEFVEAVREKFPNAILQWEDFQKSNAFTLMNRYRETLPSFNDDIQGTASVALAGIMAACRAVQHSLGEQRIVIHGAGAAGVGIGTQLLSAMIEDGVPREVARKQIAVLDSRGLVMDTDELRDEYKRALAWKPDWADEIGMNSAESHDLASVVAHFKPTVLIGASGQPNVFTQSIVKTMHKHCPRPVVLPFSNPTDYAEAKPEDIIRWTDGAALVATGSPFESVTHKGKTHVIGQGNNVFVFPGIGLGAILSKTRCITDPMLVAAARVLASAVTDDELNSGSLYPSVNRIREVTQTVAEAVIAAAPDNELHAAGIHELVRDYMWNLDYADITT